MTRCLQLTRARILSTPFRATGVAGWTLPGAGGRGSVAKPLMRAATTRTELKAPDARRAGPEAAPGSRLRDRATQLQRTAGNGVVARWLVAAQLMRAPSAEDLERLSYEDELANERFLAANEAGQFKSELGDIPALGKAGRFGVDLKPILKNKRRARGPEVLKDALAVLASDVPGTKDSATARAFDVKTAWELGVDLPKIVRGVRAKSPITKERIDSAIDEMRSQMAAVVQEFEKGGGGAEVLGALGVADKDRDPLYSRLLFSGYKPDEIAAVLGELRKATSDVLGRAGTIDKQVEILLPLLRRHTATAAVDAEVNRIKERFQGGKGEWDLLGGTVEDREWVYSELRARGHDERAIGAALKALQDGGGLVGVRQERKRALEVKLRALRPVAAMTVNEGDFPERAYKMGEAVDPYVLEAAARAEKAGSTIEPNPYVERHFTPELMTFLLENPDVTIEVYEGRTGEALGHLARLGFKEIRELSDNPVTDFRKFTARKPDTGDVALVVVAFPGRAYEREIAAHFVYYNLDKPSGERINPARVHHHRLDEADASKSDFTATLERLGLDPDVVLMGNVEQIKAKLAERGIEPMSEVAAPSLYGVLYTINGKAVLSLKVEPYLYADRAGSFVSALQSRSTKRRAIIFTGTAGALDQSMEIGDLVAPGSFAQTDTLTRTPVADVSNLATDILNELASARGPEGVYSGEKVSHGAVDTILFEDKDWFKAHEKMSIVEQEVAGIATAVAASSKLTRLFAFFRISDVLGKQDFSHNETERPPERTKFDQGDVAVSALEKELGALKPSGPPTQPGVATGTVSKDDASVSYVLGQHLITLYRGHLKALQKLDRKLATQLEERIPQILHANKDAGPAEIEKAVLALYREYGVKSVVAKKMLTTPIRIKYTGSATPVKVKLTYGTATADMDAVKAAGVFWTCTFEDVPSMKGKVKVTAGTAEKERELTTGTGKDTFIEIP
jgi:Phosphorylase superfamily